MSLTVDLNADLGEGSAHDFELLEFVTSANISCGFHAGDPATILRSIRDATEKNVAVGAHPSFLDRENFGRLELDLAPAEVFAQVTYQIGAFSSLATAAGTAMTHVKPHGALYNMAARRTDLAEAIVEAIVVANPYLLLFAPANSALSLAGEKAELQVVKEAFADRNYLNDGSLVPRARADALLHDPVEAASRVIRMLREGKVRSVEGADIEISAETICLHGDTPNAVQFAENLQFELRQNGVAIEAPEIAS